MKGQSLNLLKELNITILPHLGNYLTVSVCEFLSSFVWILSMEASLVHTCLTLLHFEFQDYIFLVKSFLQWSYNKTAFNKKWEKVTFLKFKNSHKTGQKFSQTYSIQGLLYFNEEASSNLCCIPVWFSNALCKSPGKCNFYQKCKWWVDHPPFNLHLEKKKLKGAI